MKTGMFTLAVIALLCALTSNKVEAQAQLTINPPISASNSVKPACFQTEFSVTSDGQTYSILRIEAVSESGGTQILMVGVPVPSGSGSSGYTPLPFALTVPDCETVASGGGTSGSMIVSPFSIQSGR